MLRRRQVERELGVSRSAIYRQMLDGVLPRPVKVAPKRVGWIRAEVDAVCQARIAGASHDALRILVTQLQRDRKGPLRTEVGQ